MNAVVYRCGFVQRERLFASLVVCLASLSFCLFVSFPEAAPVPALAKKSCRFLCLPLIINCKVRFENKTTRCRDADQISVFVSLSGNVETKFEGVFRVFQHSSGWNRECT